MCAMYRNVGVQGRRVRGYVGLRVRAGPCQPGECPGLQGAAGEHPGGAILRVDGEAKPSAGHRSSVDLCQAIRATRPGDQVRIIAGENATTIGRSIIRINCRVFGDQIPLS